MSLFHLPLALQDEHDQTWLMLHTLHKKIKKERKRERERERERERASQVIAVIPRFCCPVGGVLKSFGSQK